mgnify:CR=1 FL=1
MWKTDWPASRLQLIRSAVAPLSVSVLFRQLRGRAEHGSHERIVLRPQVVDRGDVLPAE